MRIESLYIDGYGVFRDASLPSEGAQASFSPTLAVVLGPNESGKSTLLSFIRTILFGFADARTTENRYPPLRGGRHGGRIIIADRRGGRYVVERLAGSRGGALAVTLPDGSEGGMDDLNALLGNASRDLFRNVFAFSLSELQAFETLTSEGVRARIYGAGIGTGRLVLADIEREIDQQRQKLFKESGSSQEIPKLFQEGDTLKARLRQLSDRVSQYDSLRRNLDSLTADLLTTKGNLLTEQSRLVHVRNLIQAWDDWTELQASRGRLSQLPEVVEFPPDGVVRLERIVETSRSLQENLIDLQTRLVKAKNELDSIQVDERMLRAAPKIETLRRGLNAYESAKKDLPGLQAELKAKKRDLAESLRYMGPGWDEERVKGFDTSLPVREAVRSHGKALLNASQEFRDAQQEVRSAKSLLGERRKEHERLEKVLERLSEPGELNMNALEARRLRARELLFALPKHRGLLEKSEHLRERRADRESYLASIETQLRQSVAFLPMWPALLAAVIVVALAGWFASKGEWFPFVGVVLLVGIIALAYSQIRAQQSKRMRERIEVLQEEKGTISNTLLGLDEDLHRVSNQIAGEETTLRRAANALGFDTIPTVEDMESLDMQIQKAVEELRGWNEAKQRVTEAHDRVDEQEERVRKAEDTESQARDNMLAVHAEWATCLEERAIDTDLSTDTCLELLSRVESAYEKIKALEDHTARIETVESAMRKYEKMANDVLESCKQSERPRDAFPAVVDELIKCFEENQHDSEMAVQLRRIIEERTLEEDHLRCRYEQIDNERKELLSQASAETEEEFHELARIHTERESLLSSIRERTKNLERIAGRGNALEEFLNEIKDMTPEELHRRERELGQKVSEMELQRDERNKEWGRIDDQVKKLEAEDESSVLRFRLGGVIGDLRKKAHEWSVLSIAQAFLKKARERYERERQPAVVQEAQAYFSCITGRRYPRLLSPPGENRIAIEDQRGERKDVGQLSRGTAEQLYLALRFGLVQEFGRRSETLPVVMDDVLANFDPRRAREACKAIKLLTENHQVILFTCHPETVDLLRSEIKGFQVIELGSLGN
ncbi:MAG: hypothetical protein FJ012_03815 [Chloroflexi bacterium]|nr:hypothetical protein [Chloroflexota bacterium]